MSKTGTVTVTSPRRRKAYVNGNYTPSLPKTSPCTFAVEYGENVFETVNGDDRIDFRGSVTTNDANKDCDLELEPVVPPEPK